MNQDEHQVSGSLPAALAGNQDMQDMQSTSSPAYILTGDPELDEMMRNYNPLTDPYAIFNQTQEEAFADLDEILVPNRNPASTHNAVAQPSQWDNIEPDQFFENNQNSHRAPHHPDLEFFQEPMTPGDVEHPYFPLIDDYTGLDMGFDLPQDPWSMIDDFNAPLDYSAHTPNLQSAQLPVLPPIETPATGAYQYRFNTFEAAHAAIAASHTEETMLPLGLDTDDWELVWTDKTHYYAALLLEALCKPPVGVPEAMTNDYQKTYWREHQDSTLVLVKNVVTSSPEVAEARAMLVVEAVTTLHSKGCPASVMNRKTLKEGYKVDTTLKASARLQQIIHAASQDKYVAHDIVTGTNIPDIVRSPMAYLKRKGDNSKVNSKKAMDKEEADRNKGVVARKKTGGRKGRNDVAGLQQQNAYPTPGPGSPAGLYGGMGPIPFALNAGDGVAFDRPLDDGEEIEYKFE